MPFSGNPSSTIHFMFYMALFHEVLTAMFSAVLWVQEQLKNGLSPRSIVAQMMDISQLPYELVADENALLKLVVEMLTEPPKRRKLPQYNTLDDAVRLIKTAKNILVLTGAGVREFFGI